MTMQENQCDITDDSNTLDKLGQIVEKALPVKEAETALAHMRTALGGVSVLVKGLIQNDPSYAQVSGWIDETLAKSAAEEIKQALATKPDFEAMHPLALQFYTSAASALASEDFILSVSTKDWYANAKYAEITIEAVGYDTEYRHPIAANFIYDRKTGRLGTREEILKAISEYPRPDTGFKEHLEDRLKNQPIYGLEISVRNFPLSLLAQAVLEAFQKAELGNKMLKRATTSEYPGEYGYDSMVFYLPQNKEELTDRIPEEFKTLKFCQR